MSAELAAAPTPVVRPAGPIEGGGGEFHIPSLDGIRAVSFMLVFLSHSGLNSVVPGGLGVTIFFFLSGYLITTLLRLERARTGSNSLRDFYLRRVFRILPPFYTVLALSIALTLIGVLPLPLRLDAVIAQLTHITNYWLIFSPTKGDGFPPGTVVYWSLAVEEHFYLAFPCLFIALQRWLPSKPTRQASALLGLCLLILLWRCVLVANGAPSDRTNIATDTRVDSILFGCALALQGNPMLDAWRGSKNLWRYWLFPAGCALLLSSVIIRAPWFRETLRYSVQGIALVPLFVVAIRYPDWLPMRVLNQPLVRRVGLLSYSLYLCHQVFLAIFELRYASLGYFVSGTVSLALSLIFASLVLQYIERPAARMRKNWVKTTWLKPVPTSAAKINPA